MAEHMASLDVAAGLGATLALPGHGRPLEALPELFADNVRGLEERLDKARAALDGRAATPAELLDEIFPVTENAADRVWRLIELTGYLEHLRLEGELARDGDEVPTMLMRGQGAGPRPVRDAIPAGATARCCTCCRPRRRR